MAAAQQGNDAVLRNSFVFWNNKGGVGKSTLCFQSSCLKAARELARGTNRNVLVVDMCPQASLSMQLLGGRCNGADRLHELREEELNNNDLTQTVVGVLEAACIAVRTRVTRNQHPKVDTKRLWHGTVKLTNVQETRIDESGVDDLPNNLFLLPGHSDLDLLLPTLYRCASSDIYEWKKTLTTLKDAIKILCTRHNNENGYNREWVIYIDTNPAFTIYTQIALVAAEKIFCPVTPDEFALNGFHKLRQSIYGGRIPEHIIDHFVTQAADTRGITIMLPKLHGILLNRLPSKNEQEMPFAFETLLQEIQEDIGGLLQNSQSRGQFTEEFGDANIIRIFDWASMQAWMSNRGKPIYSTPERQTNLHKEEKKLNDSGGNRSENPAAITRCVKEKAEYSMDQILNLMI